MRRYYLGILTSLLVCACCGQAMSQARAVWGVSSLGIFKTDSNYANPQLVYQWPNAISGNEELDDLYQNYTSFVYYPHLGICVGSGSYWRSAHQKDNVFIYDVEKNDVEFIPYSQGHPFLASNGRVYYYGNGDKNIGRGLCEYDPKTKTIELVVKNIELKSAPIEHKGVLYFTAGEKQQDEGAEYIYRYLPGASKLGAVLIHRIADGEMLIGPLSYEKKSSALLYWISKKENGVLRTSAIRSFQVTNARERPIAYFNTSTPSYGGLVEWEGYWYGTVDNKIVRFDNYRSSSAQTVATYARTQDKLNGTLKLTNSGNLLGSCFTNGSPVSAEWKRYRDLDGSGSFFIRKGNSFIKSELLTNVVPINKGYSPSDGVYISTYQRVGLCEMPNRVVTNHLSKTVCDFHYVHEGDTLWESGIHTKHYVGYRRADSLVILDLSLHNIAGDANCNGIIDNGEICGDVDKDGTMRDDELAGDRNGNGIIDEDEKLGDLNGNGIIDNFEISGDGNGDGQLNGTERAGSENSDKTLVLKSNEEHGRELYAFELSQYTNDSIVTFELTVIPYFPELNLGAVQLGFEVDDGNMVYYDSIQASLKNLDGAKDVTIYKTYPILNRDEVFTCKVYSRDDQVSDTVLYTYTRHPTSIRPIARANEYLRLSPNPANTFIDIYMESSDKAKMPQHYQVLDMQGRILIESDIDWQDEANRLDVKTLEPGNYILQLQGKRNTHTALFIKQ